jgi:hypothetical protein
MIVPAVRADGEILAFRLSNRALVCDWMLVDDSGGADAA